MTAGSTALWGDAPAPAPRLQTVVVVPVRNEAEGLTLTLRSLAGQRELSGAPLDARRFEVLLLANNCDDGSALLAREFAAAHPGLALHVAEVVLPPADAHIGHVRKLLMDAACERLATARHDAPGPARGAGAGAETDAGARKDHGGVIASTDADTVVDALWLAQTERAFTAGADAVGGRIVLDPQLPLPPRTLRRHRCDSAYRLALARLEDLLDPDPADPWPRHHQHFCASLAVSRKAYAQVGGVPAVRYLEDVALVAALRAADLRIRHSPEVRVMTSPRAEGRVEVGLSWQLRQWADGEADGGSATGQVDAPLELAARWRARRGLRAAWQTGDAPVLRSAAFDVASQLQLQPSPAWWQVRAETTTAFGALWADVLAHAAPPAQVPVQDALHTLRALISAHQRRTSGPAQRSKTSSR